jgi:hypothetical protein
MPIGAELKLRRAREHIAAAAEIVQEWLGGDAFLIESKLNLATGRTERRVRLSEAPPDQLALVVGDAVHNLRAALDHAVFDAASECVGGTLTEKEERALAFPVLKSRPDEGFHRKTAPHLPHVPREVRKVIEEEQPYQWTTPEDPDGYCFRPVWQIHELDRIDKHRRLTVTAASLEYHAIGVPDGVEPDVKFCVERGPVKDGQLLATYLGAEVGVQYMFDRNVVVMDGGIGVRDADVGDQLDTLLRHVEYTVWRVRTAASESSTT